MTKKFEPCVITGKQAVIDHIEETGHKAESIIKLREW